jgi:hypothetical protein
VTDPGAERPRRTEALKLVESGVAAGIVVPSYAMLFFHHDERSEFYAWQREAHERVGLQPVEHGCGR